MEWGNQTTELDDALDLGNVRAYFDMISRPGACLTR